MARPVKDDPMFVWIDGGINDLYDALRDRFTLSTRQLCVALKCQRPWIAKYIRPFVPHIYVTRNSLLRDSDTGMHWDSEALQRHIADHATFTRRSVSIAGDRHIPSDKVYELHRLWEMMGSPSPYTPDSKWERFVNKHLVPELDDEGKRLLKAQVRARNGLQWVPAHSLDFDVHGSWCTTASMTDWGDTSEMVQRRIFNRCMTRVSIDLPDENGCVRNKIMYADDMDNHEWPVMFHNWSWIVPAAAL